MAFVKDMCKVLNQSMSNPDIPSAQVVAYLSTLSTYGTGMGDAKAYIFPIYSTLIRK